MGEKAAVIYSFTCNDPERGQSSAELNKLGSEETWALLIIMLTSPSSGPVLPA